MGCNGWGLDLYCDRGQLLAAIKVDLSINHSDYEKTAFSVGSVRQA